MCGRVDIPGRSPAVLESSGLPHVFFWIFQFLGSYLRRFARSDPRRRPAAGSKILETPHCIGPNSAVRGSWGSNRLLPTTQGSYPFDWWQLWRCPASPNQKSTAVLYFPHFDKWQDPGKISRPRTRVLPLYTQQSILGASSSEIRVF